MKKLLKWVGFIVVSLAVIIVLAVVIFSSKGKSAVEQNHEVTATLLSEVPSDSTLLARGKHLAMTTGCVDCHGENLEGRVFVDAPPFLVTAPNLTTGAGGIGASYSVEDWDRAIRYGVKPSGQAVVIMPSKTYHNLSDDDTASIIAYFKSIPPIDNDLPEREFRMLGKLLAGAGQLDVAESVHLVAERKAKPAEGATAEYGDYIASLTCTYCHGKDLRGGPPLDPNMPLPTDLTAAGTWSFEDFAATLRTGVTPYGKEMNPEYMPWTFTKNMTDDELTALYKRFQELSN